MRAWGLPEYVSQANSKQPAAGVTSAQTIDPVTTSSDSPVTQDSKKAGTASGQQKALSFADAAERVLEDYGNKKPMHYQAITKEALDRRYLHSSGKTPAATLYSVISEEIVQEARRGNTPRFVLHGRGLFGLTKWEPRGIAGRLASRTKLFVR